MYKTELDYGGADRLDQCYTSTSKENSAVIAEKSRCINQLSDSVTDGIRDGVK